MEAPTINVINLPYRTDKRDHIISEFKKQGVDSYEFWSGVVHNPKFAAIARAHKAIVRDAKNRNLPFVVIAEDDCIFPDFGSWQYYLDNMPKDFSIYLSSVYFGDINEYGVVKDFCGFTLYTVHSSYYDTFLETPEVGHIDRLQCERRQVPNHPDLLIPKGKFIVCPLFCSYQIEVPSDNTTDENIVRIVSNNQYLYYRKFHSNSQPFFTWEEIQARSVAPNNALIATSL